MKNEKIFKALSSKLKRDIRYCEECGDDLINSLYFIQYEDRHSGLPHQLDVVCRKCFKGNN